MVEQLTETLKIRKSTKNRLSRLKGFNGCTSLDDVINFALNFMNNIPNKNKTVKNANKSKNN